MDVILATEAGSSITGFFENHLIETLIMVVLMFNAGAYGVLWNRTEDNEDEIESVEENLEEKIEGVEAEVQGLEQGQAKIMRTMYGAEEDETEDGHIVNTKQEFEEVHCLIEESNKARVREHEEVKGLLLRLIDQLDEEENVDLDLDIDDYKYGSTDD